MHNRNSRAGLKNWLDGLITFTRRTSGCNLLGNDRCNFTQDIKVQNQHNIRWKVPPTRKRLCYVVCCWINELTLIFKAHEIDGRWFCFRRGLAFLAEKVIKTGVCVTKGFMYKDILLPRWTLVMMKS